MRRHNFGWRWVLPLVLITASIVLCLHTSVGCAEKTQGTQNVQSADNVQGDTANAPGIQIVPGSQNIQNAEVTITTNPIGADAYLDGAFAGKTPVTFKCYSGTHTIKAGLKGYYIREEKISLAQNEVRRFDLTLTEYVPPPYVAPSPCFIATAAFGTPLAKQIQILQQFRDKYLVTNFAGKKFVSWYYRNGPVAAGYIQPRPIMKAIVRIALYPLIAFSFLLLNGLLPYLVLAICGGILVYRLKPGVKSQQG